MMMCESLPCVLGLKREDDLNVPQLFTKKEEDLKLLLEARANVYATISVNTFVPCPVKEDSFFFIHLLLQKL
jgi:hypothetical protein